MSENNRIPDPLLLLPDTQAAACVRFCFKELSLSMEETTEVLYDAHKIAQALKIIMSGRIISNEPHS